MNIPKRVLRVLIVDDEALIANTLALILDTNGYQTKAVYSAEEAIGSFDDFRPDFVISDVVMRQKTGIDLALHVTALDPACRVLLISGNTGTGELLSTYLPAGISFPILAKPVPPGEILDFLAAGSA